jgi:ribosomal protein L7/L12
MNKRTKKEKTTKTSNQKRTRKHLRVVENWAPVETNAAKHETTTALSETISEKIETIGAAVETSDKSDASYLSAAADSPAPAVDLDTEPTQSEVPLTLSTEDAISVVIVNREALLNGLKVAKDFIGKKNTMPILSSALLTVRRDELGRSFITLAVTDLEVSWKTTYPCEATAEISQCAPLDTLYSEVKALPGDITDAVLAFKKNANV